MTVMSGAAFIRLCNSISAPRALFPGFRRPVRLFEPDTTLASVLRRLQIACEPYADCLYEALRNGAKPYLAFFAKRVPQAIKRNLFHTEPVGPLVPRIPMNTACGILHSAGIANIERPICQYKISFSGNQDFGLSMQGPASATDHFRTRRIFFDGKAQLVDCIKRSDDRGTLLPYPLDRLPFLPCRAFVVSDVPAGTIRGGHSHRSGIQMLVCLKGRIEVLMRHRDEEIAVSLSSLSQGLVLQAGVWSQQTHAQHL